MTDRIKRRAQRSFTEIKPKRAAPKQTKRKLCSETETEASIKLVPDSAAFAPYDETLLDFAARAGNSATGRALRRTIQKLSCTIRTGPRSPC
jgi:hypothetical protein